MDAGDGGGRRSGHPIRKPFELPELLSLVRKHCPSAA
jgi:hypothetical protein